MQVLRGNNINILETNVVMTWLANKMEQYTCKIHRVKEISRVI